MMHTNVGDGRLNLAAIMPVMPPPTKACTIPEGHVPLTVPKYKSYKKKMLFYNVITKSPSCKVS